MVRVILLYHTATKCFIPAVWTKQDADVFKSEKGFEEKKKRCNNVFVFLPESTVQFDSVTQLALFALIWNVFLLHPEIKECRKDVMRHEALLLIVKRLFFYYSCFNSAITVLLILVDVQQISKSITAKCDGLQGSMTSLWSVRRPESQIMDFLSCVKTALARACKRRRGRTHGTNQVPGSERKRKKTMSGESLNPSSYLRPEFSKLPACRSRTLLSATAHQSE